MAYIERGFNIHSATLDDLEMLGVNKINLEPGRRKSMFTKILEEALPILQEGEVAKFVFNDRKLDPLTLQKRVMKTAKKMGLDIWTQLEMADYSDIPTSAHQDVTKLSSLFIGFGFLKEK